MSNPDAKWYVLHTYSGYENKVAQNIDKVAENRGLTELFEEVRIPTEIVTEIKDTGKKEVERKLFPGYVLVKMVLTDESWYAVRGVRGVTGFLGTATRPIPLTSDEISRMGVETREVTVNYDVGDNVKVIEGSLEGFVGVVEELMLDQNLVKVSVSMFGRENVVELAPEHVRAMA